MKTAVETLDDLLHARQECLSGHELAMVDDVELHVLGDALNELQVSIPSIATSLGVAAQGVNSILGLLKAGSNGISFDAVVARLEAELNPDDRVSMAP